MANVKNVQEYGNQLAVFLDDGTRVLCFPTVGGLWLPATGGVVPPDPDDFKFPFPRNLHTTYAGHSGADWPGDSVGNDADIHVIGAGTVVERYAYPNNTYPGDSSEPVWRGNCLVIDHGTIGGDNIRSLYAHIRDAPSLSVNDTVTAGQVIGRVGNTGYSTGAHLHFEININGQRRPQDSVPSGYTVTMDWMDANASGSWA